MIPRSTRIVAFVTSWPAPRNRMSSRRMIAAAAVGDRMDPQLLMHPTDSTTPPAFPSYAS
jgi:hypothetical protein